MDLWEMIKKDRPAAKDTTVSSYARTIDQLWVKMGHSPDKPFKDVEWLTVEDPIIEALNDYSDNTQKMYFISISVALQAVGKIKYADDIAVWDDLAFNKADAVKGHYQSGKMSPKQKVNWVSMVELRKARDAYMADVEQTFHWYKFQDYLIGCLYTMLEPMRSDYANMVIVLKEKYDRIQPRSQNYLVKNPDGSLMLSIANYKTSTKYGEKQIKVPPDLHNVLSRWFDIKPVLPGADVLLINKTKTAMSSNGLVKAVARAFKYTGKKVSINLIREVRATEELGGNKEKSERLAQKMGHSVKTQQSVYIKKAA